MTIWRTVLVLTSRVGDAVIKALLADDLCPLESARAMEQVVLIQVMPQLQILDPC